MNRFDHLVFDPDEIDRVSNVRQNCKNGLFVSHSGLDDGPIRSKLAYPIWGLFRPDGIFMHSSRSGAADAYVHLVFAALNYCDKFLVCASRNSAINSFVRDEVDWILGDQKRSIIACSLDGTEPSAVHPGLAQTAWKKREGKLYLLRPDLDLPKAQSDLSTIIHAMLRESPFRYGG